MYLHFYVVGAFSITYNLPVMQIFILLGFGGFVALLAAFLLFVFFGFMFL
jgi:hypothetical protein